MNLAAMVLKNSGLEIEDMVEGAVNRSIGPQDIIYFCTMFRRVGIAHHYVTGRIDFMFEQLFHSGRAYSYFLEGCSEEKKCTSRAIPFWDAVACRDEEGASQIAQVARRTHNPIEYEEDFLYYDFMMDLFYRDASEETLKGLLKRYEEILCGDEDSRLSICQAFLEKDQELFDESIQKLLESFQATYEEKVANESIDPDHAQTTARLSIEGLALVLLAKRRDLEVEKEYVQIPAAVLKDTKVKHPEPDGWKQRVSFSIMG